MRASTHLRKYMDKHGLTQKAVAEMAGISQPTVGLVLRGEPIGIKVRIGIARVLGVDWQKLSN